jgi:hypothetical protein
VSLNKWGYQSNLQAVYWLRFVIPALSRIFQASSEVPERFTAGITSLLGLFATPVVCATLGHSRGEGIPTADSLYDYPFLPSRSFDISQGYRAVVPGKVLA